MSSCWVRTLTSSLLRPVRLQEVETALREALQEKELLERKLARLQASREGEVAALKVLAVLRTPSWHMWKFLPYKLRSADFPTAATVIKPAYGQRSAWGI